jgi:hypothetical protein
MRLASRYKAEGTEPDGTKYTGTVTVSLLSDTTFAIQWDVDGSISKGFGMRRNDTLAATYTTDGKKEQGLIIYQVDGTGLTGLWSYKGESGVGTEHLTPND